jgi:hypothetical protein
LKLLAGSDLRCPPFDDYVDALVRYVREVQAQRRTLAASEEDADPFDPDVSS